MAEIILTTPDQLEQVIMQALKKVLPMKEKELPAEPPDTCSLEQALEFLARHGYVVSKSKLYKLTALKEIPFRYFGRKIIFSRKELLAWMESITTLDSGASDVFLTLSKSARRKVCKQHQKY
jgi:excisionase family DNA binding protein